MAARQAAFEHLRKFAKAYPEASEDFPWGECAIKVRKKIFAFLRSDIETGLALTVKLPASKEFALEYDFTAPTGYGLGKSGWVTASFAPGVKLPMDILEAWIDESYRAVAPKKLAAALSPQ